MLLQTQHADGGWRVPGCRCVEGCLFPGLEGVGGALGAGFEQHSVVPFPLPTKTRHRCAAAALQVSRRTSVDDTTAAVQAAPGVGKVNWVGAPPSVFLHRKPYSTPTMHELAVRCHMAPRRRLRRSTVWPASSCGTPCTSASHRRLPNRPSSQFSTEEVKAIRAALPAAPTGP